MSHNSFDNEYALSAEQIANSIKYLGNAFKAACASHRDVQRKNGARTATYVLRNLKTHKAIVEKDTDLTLYYAQQDFAHIMNDIQRGPFVLISNEIKKANDLIDSLTV
jgi:hypothetical protein